MEAKELQRICEAILFAAGEPVETERLSFAAEVDPDEVRSVMKELMDLYAFERRGIRILRLEDSWQMCSQNDLAPWVTRALETRKPPKLSASQLETLTIIAYYQPTTKAFVEKLRGVDSAWSVSALLNKKLIEEDGRLEAPGRPILYVTTPDFLRTGSLVVHAVDLQTYNLAYLFLIERLEHDSLIYSVQELRTDRLPQQFKHLVPRRLGVHSFLRILANKLRTQVRG